MVIPNVHVDLIWSWLFKHWIVLSTTIQWIGSWETDCVVYWIEIYPVDSVIQLSNSWAQWHPQTLSDDVDKS